MVAVMIGVDPHKGSHTAVAIGAAEEPLGSCRSAPARPRPSTLVAWAAAWPERTWAVEGAGGLGHLLAQQLVAAGERVLDVPPKLAARVRLLQAGDTNKNDPNDAAARSRSRRCARRARRRCAAEDHAAVLKVWSKRHRDLAGPAIRWPAALTRCCASCVARRRPQGDHRSSGRPHPGAGHAVRAGRGGAPRAGRRVPGGPARPGCPAPRHQEEAGRGRRRVGHQPDRGLRLRPGQRRRRDRRRHRRDPFPSRDHFASYNGTAPVEVSSGSRKIYRLSLRGNRRINHALHMAAITQIRHAAQRRPRLLRAKDRRRQDPQRSPPLPQTADQRRHLRPPPGRCPAARRRKGPGGQPGNNSASSAAGYTPHTSSSGKPLPGLLATLRPRPVPETGLGIPRAHLAAGDAAGPAGAPAAKRGRTTWRCGKATAKLGPGEGQRPPALGAITPHLTRREKISPTS